MTQEVIRFASILTTCLAAACVFVFFLLESKKSALAVCLLCLATVLILGATTRTPDGRSNTEAYLSRMLRGY